VTAIEVFPGRGTALCPDSGGARASRRGPSHSHCGTHARKTTQSGDACIRVRGQCASGVVSMGYGTQPDHIAESSMTSSRHIKQRQVKMWDTATWFCTCSAEGPLPGDRHTGAELCLSVGKYVVSVSEHEYGGCTCGPRLRGGRRT